MNFFQSFKRARSIDSATPVDNATMTAYAIDLAGSKECGIIFSLGTMDIGITALYLQESDVLTDATTLATPTQITGTIYGTSADPLTGVTSATPTGTADGMCWAWSLNTKARKRYVQVVAVAGNGTVGAAASSDALLILENGPRTAAEHGYGGLLTV